MTADSVLVKQPFTAQAPGFLTLCDVLDRIRHNWLLQLAGKRATVPTMQANLRLLLAVTRLLDIH